MLRRAFAAVIAVLATVTSSAAAQPIAARTSGAVAAHKLTVAVEKNLVPAAGKRLAVLVLIGQRGGASAGVVATSSNPITVLLDNRGFYVVKAEIDSSCKGSCDASYRVSGSADHKLEIVPSCRANGSGFVCSKLEIVKAY